MASEREIFRLSGPLHLTAVDWKKMKEIGADEIERLATKNSIRSLLVTTLGKEYSEPLHLLPSSYLTISQSASLDFKQAHGIHQWWRPDIHCQSKLYQFRICGHQVTKITGKGQ